MSNVEMVNAVAKNSEIRAYVRPSLKRLIKALAGLKNTDRDWTISDCVAEALEDWLKKPENQALIEKHRLNSSEDEDTTP